MTLVDGFSPVASLQKPSSYIGLKRSLGYVWRAADGPLFMKIPDNWETLEFPVDGQNVRCFHAQADNPIGCIYILAGFKDVSERYVPFANAANRMGLSVVVAELPNPGKETKYLKHYRKIGKEMFLNNTPLFGEYEGLPIYFLTHSTGGTMETELLAKKGLSSEIVDKSNGSVFVAPFYIPGFAKKKVYKKLQDAYAWAMPQAYYGETPMDYLHMAFYRAQGRPQLVDKTKRPTQSQIKYMSSKCPAVLDRVRRKGFSKDVKEYPTLSVVGMRDYVADPLTNLWMTEQMHSGFIIEEDGWHSAHLEIKDVGQKVLQAILDDISGLRSLGQQATINGQEISQKDHN